MPELDPLSCKNHMYLGHALASTPYLVTLKINLLLLYPVQSNCRALVLCRPLRCPLVSRWAGWALWGTCSARRLTSGQF
jgi:hypothetical protein